ncbi:hypothetical protein F3Y22_tig00110607pilonHSYRG00007 [Hibiscus syriacus]|uniref:Retrotransposon Copia-like N-terminal domain-containing protein n=1 Tax=Hibiscus syriacus TaxID=106335 RepID=A0A6A3A250_HIBSY|nr:hypothetical protein F3Y22_tig00110607pilonHSYRG00007 [Hibiscus syriacus]
MAPSSTTNNLMHLNAPTNFTIKLTSVDFLAWRRQMDATLIGVGLISYIDGLQPSSSQFTDIVIKIANHEYLQWYRQNKILISVILGSCGDLVQPLVSPAFTAKIMWDTLVESYVCASPGYILILKSKLARNPRGSKSISDYMKDMQDIASGLALVNCPISYTDLLIFIVNQLGDRPIVVVRNTNHNT